VYADANLAGGREWLVLGVHLLVDLDVLGLGAEEFHLALALLGLLQLRRGLGRRRRLGRQMRLQRLDAGRMQRTAREGDIGGRRGGHAVDAHRGILVRDAVGPEGHLAGQRRRAHGLAVAVGGGRGIVAGGGNRRRALAVVLLGRLVGVGSLRRQLAGTELRRGSHGGRGRGRVDVSGGAAACRRQAGLEVALRALAGAVAKVRLAVRRGMLSLSTRNAGPREVVCCGRFCCRGCARLRLWGRGRQGRLALLQRHLRVVRVRVIERSWPAQRRCLRRRRRRRGRGLHRRLMSSRLRRGYNNVGRAMYVGRLQRGGIGNDRDCYITTIMASTTFVGWMRPETAVVSVAMSSRQQPPAVDRHMVGIPAEPPLLSLVSLCLCLSPLHL
jgi:hypothetical protein